MMSKCRPKLFVAFILSVALLVVCASPVFANSEDESVDAIAITVIIPPVSERPTHTQPTQPTRRIFPINVAEGYNYEGIRELVRVYELLPGEKPEWINTDSFTRNGYYYQIAEIVRRVDVAHTVREHTEVVEVPSSTNNLAGVLAGLSPTMDFVDEDGYVGVLHLDIRSIAMTQDGTSSTSRQVSQTREFPHLSNPDMALIPLTIDVSGRTYTLADVDWRGNTFNPIDFNSVAQTFTAFATYTRTATSTVSTGYTTVATYSGVLTRVSTGDMRFVATFIGTPILSPIVNQPTTNTEHATTEQEAKPCVAANEEKDYGESDKPITEIIVNGDYDEPAIPDAEVVYEPKQQEPIEEHQDNGTFSRLMLLAVPLLVIIAVLVVIALKLKKKADALTYQDYNDSADALCSRTARIVKRDRKELAKYAGYEDEHEPDNSDESTEFKGFVSGYKNIDEEGDNDD